MMRQITLYTMILLFATVQAFGQGTTKYEYDEMYRLTKVTYGNGVTVSYTYDALGNRLTKKTRGSGDLGETAPVTIGNSGKASYCGDKSLDFSFSEEVKAYIATGFDKNKKAREDVTYNTKDNAPITKRASRDMDIMDDTEDGDGEFELPPFLRNRNY